MTTAEHAPMGDLAKTGRKKSQVDYKEILSPEDFSVYAELRNLRKQIAEDEGIPAYAVFTNAQLAWMVTDNICSNTALSAGKGIGQARVEKYSAQFLSCLEQCRKKQHLEQ
ncbi:MAG: HRDC domain-containing protein [Candidatus Electrothrix sp. GW3-4]|uniref:HRDC domain-containing protein n=1 Tax=Candidatus Electrothrix sp. GW3-4 TaxID=3126740 RepID=UPI0030CDADBE